MHSWYHPFPFKVNDPNWPIGLYGLFIVILCPKYYKFATRRSVGWGANIHSKFRCCSYCRLSTIMEPSWPWNNTFPPFVEKHEMWEKTWRLFQSVHLSTRRPHLTEVPRETLWSCTRFQVKQENHLSAFYVLLLSPSFKSSVIKIKCRFWKTDSRTSEY